MTEPRRRKIRLTFVATGESVAAELLDDEAPEVCRLVWDLLPVEGQVLHGMYSGAEVFLLLDRPVPQPPENLCQLPLPGEVLLFTDTASSAANSKKPVTEICFVYSCGVVLRGPEGSPPTALCSPAYGGTEVRLGAVPRRLPAGAVGRAAEV